MSSINPVPQQSVIKLARGVQWDNSYKDIRLFRTEAEREQYFLPKLANVWTNCSVVKENQIMLGGNMQEYLSCNYMIFTNNGFTNAKTFYCFITSIDYVNVNTFRVTYEIDWIQSYIFDFKFELSYVEREHVQDDTRGKNLVDENLEIGEYVIDSQLKKVYQPGFIALTNNETNAVNVENNVVTGLSLSKGSLQNLDALQAIVDKYNETPEKIVIINMSYAGNTSMHDTYALTKETSSFKFREEVYTPKNNKMQCWPYKLFTVDNFQGGIQQFRWEDFNSQGQATFAVEGSQVPKPCLECFPINYKGAKATSTEVNTMQQFSVQYDNFPQVAWASDTFRAWLSQYQSYGWVSDAGRVVTSVAGMLTGGAPGMIAGLYSIGNMALDRYQEYKDHELHSSQSHGSIASSGLTFARGDIGFRFTQYSIKPEYARKIDYYFTRYGYKVDAVKVPSTRGRQYYNYVKCYDAHVDGNIPVDAKNVMESAMNNGTTFWHVNNIGATYRDNPIV